MNAQVKKAPAKNPTLQPVSFGAYPDEIERWKAEAKKVDRALSWWIRNRLLALESSNQEALVSEKA